MFLIFQVLFYLKLERTKSFKHKQDEIVNEQSYTAGLKEKQDLVNGKYKYYSWTKLFGSYYS